MTTNNVANAILYQYDYFLKNIIERSPVQIFHKLQTGTRCPNCWDDVEGTVTKSNCSTCYNVGFTGGYSTPELTYISFTEPGFLTNVDINQIHGEQGLVTQAWALTDVAIWADDFFVDDLGRRFIVEQAQPTTMFGRIYLRQVLNIQLVPDTDIIYTVPVPDLPWEV